jgi:hypothetical protein
MPVGGVLMCNLSSFWHSYKHTILFLVAVWAIMAPINVCAQAARPWVATTWTVTIDVTDSGGHVKEDPDYTYTRTNGSCPGPSTGPADPLNICAGDTVQWKVVTNSKSDHLRIFQPDAVLLDSGKNRTKRFYAKDGGTTTGGTTMGGVVPNTYEYCVAAYDKGNPYLYIHDPKIIIGTGSDEALVKNLAETAQALLERHPENRAIKKIVKDIGDLKNDLHLQ